MPTTLREYFGDLYEKCPTRQLIAGDEVIYKSWAKGMYSKVVYIIQDIDLDGDTISAFDPVWHPETILKWPIADNFGETGWLRKVTEQPYDPTQMGDKEDDI